MQITNSRYPTSSPERLLEIGVGLLCLNIEGLLPETVTTAVYGANPDLVQAATAGTKEESESAKNRLKKLLLAEFKEQAQPGTAYFANFYTLAKAINKALC